MTGANDNAPIDQEGPILYQIAEWAPTEGVPATEVHLILRIGPGVLAIRFKSRASLQAHIEGMAHHRDSVWPSVSS